MCQWETIFKNVPVGKNTHKKTFIKCAKTIKNNYKSIKNNHKNMLKSILKTIIINLLLKKDF